MSPQVAGQQGKNIMMKELDVIGPEHYAAPHPAFNPKCINESELPDNMRYKDYRMSVNGDICDINWMTQEPWDRYDMQQFVAAIRNAFRRNGCTGTINLTVRDRNCISRTVHRTIKIVEA